MALDELVQIWHFDPLMSNLILVHLFFQRELERLSSHEQMQTRQFVCRSLEHQMVDAVFWRRVALRVGIAGETWLVRVEERHLILGCIKHVTKSNDDGVPRG